MIPDRLRAALADRYRLERELGQGGMATVYLAADLKHDRQVAIKVLKPELAAVLGAERFVVEIKTTAALQHPHILPLFDSGTADGFLYYVMPFIQGETLRSKLDRETQLGIEESVRIASDVASALHYAHQHGVIHRDIKPENILLHDGRPMVADFGIALAVSAAAGGRMTETGLSLGTPHYMSPEQATAEKEISARSDVYSLGSVLYEMLTGNPPHTGASAQQIIMKIVTEEAAPVTKLRKSVPPNVAAAVAKSVEKLPADRFESARAFAEALGNTAFTRVGTASPTASALALGGRRAPLIVLAMAAVLLVAGGAGGVWLAGRVSPAPLEPMRRLNVELPDSVDLRGSEIGAAPSIAVSPDGQWLAFVGGQTRRRLFVRAIDDLTVREVAGPGPISDPQFSTDGRHLLYLEGRGTLRLIPATGGPPRTVADSVQSASWADDGQIYFVTGTRQVWTVAPTGGPPRLAITMDSTAGSRVGRIAVLPGARHAVISVWKQAGDLPMLAWLEFRSGRVMPYDRIGYAAQFVSPGYLLYSSPDGLAAIRTAADGEPRQGPERLLAADAFLINRQHVDFAASREGAVAYRWSREPPFPPTTLALVDRAGQSRILRDDGQRYDQPVVSPDGKRVVVRVGAEAFNGGNLWLLDLESSAFTPLTRGAGSYRPSWSRDGKRVLYISGSVVSSTVRALPWDGSGPDSVVVARGDIAEFAEGPPGGWSATRTYGSRDIFLVPTDSIATATPRPLITGPANETGPVIAPSGRLLGYTSDQSGIPEVFVTTVLATGPRVAVSVGGGSHPQWSADGTRLFYRAGTQLIAATIVEAPALAVTKREVVLASGLSEDGERAYAVVPGGGFVTTAGRPRSGRSPFGLVVLTNWQSLFQSGRSVASQP